MIPGDFSGKDSLKFRADLEAEIRIKDYGGKCGNALGIIGINHYGDCGKSISISAKGFSNQGLRPFCLPHPRNVCSIKFSCKNCEIEPEAYLEARFSELHACAKTIEVNVTADSSIPESRSSSFNKITASKNQIFIGQNFTEFYFIAIPSLLSNDFETINTGYHIISEISPIPGSQYTVENFATNLNIRVYINRQNNVLYTFRSKKYIGIFFVCIILGALAGVFAIAGSIMRIFELHTGRFETLRLEKDFNSIKNRNEGLYQMNFNWKIQTFECGYENLKKKISESTGLIEYKENDECQCEIISKMADSK
ncbi:hypothetical protein SteCoe_39808 [Stentor coeruleus]|uniref:Uncharacterized protein n=1 Tax=Stentor coeruleus TaxID=5963 RepID=A0A1R2AKI7_9CILI|nr:hypothetical protein SteCoe_39808 [Stentor coeruleus]